MNFCSNCGARVALRVPPGDSLPRHVCDSCGTIHYQNPKIVAGTLPVSGDRVLLCKRAIAPRRCPASRNSGSMDRNPDT